MLAATPPNTVTDNDLGCTVATALAIDKSLFRPYFNNYAILTDRYDVIARILYKQV
jgi:hypothetical protein